MDWAYKLRQYSHHSVMLVPVSFEIFRKLQRSLLYLLAVFVVSVVGSLTFGWSLIDSVYMVVITMFGVGFGEVHPLIIPIHLVPSS
jgi:Ion channel.